MENHRDISNVMQIKKFQQVFEIKSQLKTNRGKPRVPMEMVHRYLPFHVRPTLQLQRLNLLISKWGLLRTSISLLRVWIRYELSCEGSGMEAKN